MSAKAWAEQLAALAHDMNFPAGPDDLLADEHSRYALYVQALGRTSGSDDAHAIAVLVGDPDRTMAESALVTHIDRQVARMSSANALDAWVHQVRPMLPNFAFAQRRCEEWILVKRIAEGCEIPIEKVLGATDWLQRKLSTEATSESCLEALSRMGRTRRIRHDATVRMVELGKNPSA